MMRTYIDYYKLADEQDKKSKQYLKEEWWRSPDTTTYIETFGDYIETVDFLSNDEKNDSPIFENHTNVRNREWSLLSYMLGQALIDWLIENKQTNVDKVDIEIVRYMDEADVLNYNYTATTYCDSISGSLNDCVGFIVDIFNEFISRHGKNIPCEWNSFYFGLDSLKESCKYGYWTPFSDGYMYLTHDDDVNPYSFVTCM